MKSSPKSGCGRGTGTRASFLRVSLAKQDDKDPGLAVIVNNSAANETVNCQVFHGGKPIRRAEDAPDLPWMWHDAYSLYINYRPYARIEGQT